MTVAADENRLDQLSETRGGRLPAGSPTAALPKEECTASSHSFLFLLLLAFLIVAALILRIRGTHNDLWLDELISLHLACGVKSPWQVFTAIHNDNNHYLNTLYLFFLKEHGDPLYSGTSRSCAVLHSSEQAIGSSRNAPRWKH